MQPIDRRAFLASIPAALALPRLARAADAEIEVFTSETIGTVSPLLYGQFVEHLGGVVYDGVWVGPDSRVANIHGIRKALVDALKPIGGTVVRWPGGCFADSYDWRDGIGPEAQRPTRNNFWANAGRLQNVPQTSPSRNDPNQFGTNEFIEFCRLVNCQPYLAANIRSLPARDFYQWVEYCNSPPGVTTLAKARAANGSPEPFDVRFWGVGNESWGCGGDMTAEEYSVEFRKFIAWVPLFGNPLSFIASGPNAGDPKWTHDFFHAIAAKSPGLFNRIWGWALHYYCMTTGSGDSLNFSSDDAYQLLNQADRMDSLIRQTWDIMGEIDKEHKVKLVVDEWGTWHKDTTAVAPNHLFGSVQTMRDALVAGLTLDTFQRNVDKVAMANVAQLVNCIQTLFLASGDNFCVTPTYHVFAMYMDHRNGQAVRTEFSAPRIPYQYEGKSQHVVRLAGSASVLNGTLTLTGVNNHLTDALETTIQLRGASASQARAVALTGPDIHAHNDFTTPNAVKPQALAVTASGDTLRVTIPAASVVKIQAPLG
ncbi:MAG: alpha-L-arabinofuranosidase C-terminal domain-containing protein [Bryobacteraceae bacterium]